MSLKPPFRIARRIRRQAKKYAHTKVQVDNTLGPVFRISTPDYPELYVSFNKEQDTCWIGPRDRRFEFYTVNPYMGVGIYNVPGYHRIMVWSWLRRFWKAYGVEYAPSQVVWWTQ